MDFQHVLAQSGVKHELLDRSDEIAAVAAKLRGEGGFEGLDGGLDRARLTEAVESMSEGAWAGGEPGLEAIIERFTRPVMLVQDDDFVSPPDSFPDSQTVRAKLAGGRAVLTGAISSVGRIDLHNHRMDWVGTGWIVGPGLAVTNRHVAQEFGVGDGTGFAFRKAPGGRVVNATIDRYQEYSRGTESIFRIKEILWIEPDDAYDVGLLRIEVQDQDNKPLPPGIELMTQEELDSLPVGAWIAVIGYPARSPYNNLHDQQRIFDGIYGVKRLAPGTVTAIRPDGVLHHDATTLGGNSGSTVIDLDGGKAAALHFGGIEGDHNEAVQAPVVAGLIAAHA